jgi:hypothetical protein
MRSVLSVSSAAATSALVTLSDLKSVLGISGSSEDTYLGDQITTASERIASHLRVSPANDGTNSLGRETLVETFYIDSAVESLVMSRHLPRSWPMTISSVVENGTTLSGSDYLFNAATGIMNRKSGDEFLSWPCGVVAITHIAGWKLPNDATPNLPQAIQDACIAWVKLARLSKTRDPMIKSENILSGLYGYSMFQPSDAQGGMPEEVAGLLAPYVAAGAL